MVAVPCWRPHWILKNVPSVVKYTLLSLVGQTATLVLADGGQPEAGGFGLPAAGANGFGKSDAAAGAAGLIEVPIPAEVTKGLAKSDAAAGAAGWLEVPIPAEVAKGLAKSV